MTEPIVIVVKGSDEPFREEKEKEEPKEKKKKTPGRKKKVVEPMKITMLTTPLILTFD
jgi:hypothetical protein